MSPISRLILIVPLLLMSMGAAEFPGPAFDPFRMKEFDEATRSNRYFDEEIPEEIDVPRVAERVYGTQELSDRLPVTGVRIEGVVPYPAHGISKESIQALIDRRFQEERDIDLDENGFTNRDLLDIGRFLREMVDRKGWDQEDLDSLVTLMDELDVKRGWITVEQLDSIALSVTEYYREQGFILATAFVPEQEVTDGVIRLNVLEGRLGDVGVANNEIFSPETISAAFNGEIGTPVTDERIEGALRRINDLPGVRVRGSFSPGEKVGETSLTLSVLEEESFKSSILMDNHGAETTGELRLFATAEWLNMRNRGHRLLVGLLRSEGPDSSTYGLAEYELPVTKDRKGKVRATLSSNQFAVASLGAAALEITGETNNIGAMGSYQFLRGRTLNLSGQLGYTYKDVLFDVTGAPLLSRDEQIEVVSTAVDYNQLWDDAQLLVSGRLGIDQGHVINGAVRDQSTDFTKTMFSANVLKRFSIDNWFTKTESSFNLVFRMNGQYSEKFLSSVEQFSLGGPNAVRSFGVSDVSVDSGAYAGFELFFDAPINVPGMFNLPLDPLRPFVFFDYAYGVARSATGGTNRDAVIKGYGIGVRLNWPGRGAANLIFAEPSSARFDDDFSQATGESKFYFDLQYLIR